MSKQMDIVEAGSSVFDDGNESDDDSDSSEEEFGLEMKMDRKKLTKTRSFHRGCSVASPAEFVSKFGGTRVIEKILIANNGIAAVKCIRYMRQWAYDLFGNERVIKFVAMVTPEDLKANAEYIKMADHYVPVPGGSNNHNYANVELILDIAKRLPVHAVWAGWGHASENPRLPELLNKNGISFIGPSASSMWALGDKVASSIIAQSISVPTLPWSGQYVQLESKSIQDGHLTSVPHELFKKCCVHDVMQGIKAAQEIGYPVMIKASEGGGGKGIRKVLTDDEFTIGFRQVQVEVPGSPVFIMKCMDKARHLEVQILADNYGEAVSLFGRDCSVQRRHQKIIEEGPVTICKREILVEMEKHAVDLAKLVGYISAGTVEYLYDYNTKKFFFLELNPRLQVEHPCTEMITDINLPAAQLQIAMGIPLHRIKDIRLLYGEDPWGDRLINFTNVEKPPTPKGHVIACRITAENPDEGFKPSSGTIEELNFHSNKNTWGYFSVAAEGSLHEFADSQFGHLFAWGENRENARKNMVLALKDLSIRGDFRTTVEYLRGLLETDTFRKNRIDTKWLDNLICEKVKAESPDTMLAVVCGALHVADDIINKNFTQYQAALERGQIPKPDSLKNTETVELIHEGLKYVVQVTRSGPTQYFLLMNNCTMEVGIHRMSDGGLLVSTDYNSYTSYMKEEVDGYRVLIGGKTCMFQKENDPTILRSPSPGKLINFSVEDGGHVFKGEAFAEIEVMKMVMPLIASESGCVHHTRCPGAVLEPGTTVARLALDDPSHVQQASLYTGELFPPTGIPKIRGVQLHQISQHARENLVNIMLGYCLPDPYFHGKMLENVNTLIRCLKDPSLPLLEMQELMASVSGRIPQTVEDSIKGYLTKYASNITSILNQFPSQQIANVIDGYAATLTKRTERDAFFMNTQGIVQLVQRYRNGVKGHKKAIILGLLKQYLQVEMLFNEGNFEKSVAIMEEKNKDKDMSIVVKTIFSHAGVAKKNALVIKLIECLCGQDGSFTDDVKVILQEMTHLNRRDFAKITLKARQVLISSHKPSYELRHNQYESIFLSAIDLYGQQFNPENLQKIILSETAVYDVLPSFFFHRNELVRMAALEVYIRRGYQAYDLTQVQHESVDGINVIQFKFILPASHPNRTGALVKRKLESVDKVRAMTMTRVYSLSEALDELAKGDHQQEDFERMGAMTAFESVDDFLHNFDSLMELFQAVTPFHPDTLSGSSESFRSYGSSDLGSLQEDCVSPHQNEDDPVNILNICVKYDDLTLADQEREQNRFRDILRSRAEKLNERGIRRCSIILSTCRGEFPLTFTFRARDGFEEDVIYRHMEPALAFQLELSRMSLFDLRPIPCANQNLHLYFGAAKKVRDNQEVTDYRFFIRSIVRHSDFVTKEASFEYMEKASEIQLLEALDELELAFSNQNRRTDCNHIFLNFVPTVIIEPQKIEESIRTIVLRHGVRLWKLRVLQAEVKLIIRATTDSPTIPLRLFLSNESGISLDFHMYREVTDERTGQLIFQSYGRKRGPFHGLQVNTPYVTKDHLQYKRFSAQSQGTTYVYDFPQLFKQAVQKQWKEWSSHYKRDSHDEEENVKAMELMLDEDNKLISINRLPGENLVGMVAWKMVLHTPQYPDGRDLYVCANDLTSMIGSFALAEDNLYKAVIERAMADGVPFIYISANSGARIGLAEEMKHAFRVALNETGHPDKGFKYLYLTSSEFKKMAASNSVRAEPIQEEGETRYRLTDIIGKDDGIGVENLKGSGMIAGQTSKAYEEIVTMTLVTCRTVGIGSYLSRLGQRVVQTDQSHIILTGNHALNKLLGRPVYTSNNQLGGVEIMYKNGISHTRADDDGDGIAAIVNWLSYIPKAKNEPLPIMKMYDPVDREITFEPTKGAFKTRHMLTGCKDPNNPRGWLSGFFDKGSFSEILGGWALTVICGRARLGGIPVGVILPEVQAVEIVTPPDPADPNSETKTQLQAGQVWYPDSSFKTAQAINDFNQEQLPLIIFANWRGFSGGMKDMYDQVLKFGAYIVYALRKYNQPVIIYVPKNGELRGGAWVVVDPSINPEHMEMYADKESRGGVLEPSGTIEIKFKSKDLVKSMRRLDDKYAAIYQELAGHDLNVTKRRELEDQLREREIQLLPIYHQIALMFADLHDKAGRMQEKGVVSAVLEWKNSRTFLYWRLKRLLAEDRVSKLMSSPGESKIPRARTESVLERLFMESNGTLQTYLWDDNRVVAEWVEEDLNKEESVIRDYVKWYKRDAVLRDIKSILQGNPEVAMDAIVHITQQITSANRLELSRVLSALNAMHSPDHQENEEAVVERNADAANSNNTQTTPDSGITEN